MEKSFDVMKQSVLNGMDETLRSASGLSGGSAAKLKQAVLEGRNHYGHLFGNALSMALAVTEYNASMGQIVAAPTAGSSGVIPAALISVMEEYNIPKRDIIMSLFTASAIGMVIVKCASISGAEGGCQAEVGSASAMAAAALTEIFNGTPQMVSESCAIALTNTLGLVCDPVAGLVEVPCIKRNAMGVANAFTASELALAGIANAIPADEVILAMKHVGQQMPASLKETAEGGLAATPTGRRLSRELFGE
jgi:L-serine dehydratase